MATPINHTTKMNERLMTQYKNASNLKSILGTFISQVQDAEDVLQEYASKMALATATGQQLDNLGELLGRPRAGNDDTTYRVLLYLKIVQNFSEGDIETLVTIFKTLMDSEIVILDEIYPAGFNMMAINSNPIGDPDLIADVIEAAKIAGVGIGWLAMAVYPAFAFLDDTFGTTDGYGTVWDTSIGGIFARIIGQPNNDPLDDYADEEHFEDYAVDTDLVGTGEDTFTYRPHLGNTGTALVKDSGGNKVVRFDTSDNGWGGFSYNGARATRVSDAVWRWRNDGGHNRADIAFRWTAAGGYVLQWLASAELRLKKVAANWQPVTGESTIDTNDPAAPATLDKIMIRCEGNRIRCYVDYVEVFDYVDDSFASGTYGLRFPTGFTHQDADDISISELFETLYFRDFESETPGTDLVGTGDDEFEEIPNGVPVGNSLEVAAGNHAEGIGGSPGTVTYRLNRTLFDGSGNYDVFHRIESLPGGQADFIIMHTNSGGYLIRVATGATTIYRFDQNDPYTLLVSLGVFAGTASPASCQVRFIGADILVYVNDVFKGKVTDGKYRTGKLSYGCVNSGFEFDDIDVRKTRKF